MDGFSLMLGYYLGVWSVLGVLIMWALVRSMWREFNLTVKCRRALGLPVGFVFGLRWLVDYTTSCFPL